MVSDSRLVTKSADGSEYDLSDADAFDYSTFFEDMLESERLQVTRDEMSWLQTYRPPEGTADVVLNLSCGVQTTPHLMLTQVAIFQALGVDFVATAGRQYCCGRIYQRFGKPELGDRMAGKAIDRFASWSPSTNVQCCGSCLIEFDYHVEKRREAVGSAPFDVVHITRFLLDRLVAMGDAVPWRKAVPRRILLHAEGAEVHPSKAEARDAVIATLERIPGVEYLGLVANPSLGQPCATRTPGGPSVLNDITVEQYRQVQAELEAQANAVGADAIVTHHHMCHREWAKFGSDRLPVIHYQQLLAETLGVGVPDRFQMLWRLGDPDRILERSRPYWSSWGIEESEARRLVEKFFVPEYAAAVTRCPCEGSCVEAVIGSGGAAGSDLAWATTATTRIDVPLMSAAGGEAP